MFAAFHSYQRTVQMGKMKLKFEQTKIWKSLTIGLKFEAQTCDKKKRRRLDENSMERSFNEVEKCIQHIEVATK